MSRSMVDDPETTILARVIGQNESSLSQAVAQEFLRWFFTEYDCQRMSELASKARAGTLTQAEQSEADGYERVSSLLGILKSKARRAQHSTSAE